MQQRVLHGYTLLGTGIQTGHTHAVIAVYAAILAPLGQSSHDCGTALLHGKIGSDQRQRVIGGKAGGTGHLLDRLRPLAVLLGRFRTTSGGGSCGSGLSRSFGSILGCGCGIFSCGGGILGRLDCVGVSRCGLRLDQCERNGVAHLAIGKGNALNAIDGYDVPLLYGIALDDVFHGLTCFCCSRFFHVGGICGLFSYYFDRMLLLSRADTAVDVGRHRSEGQFARHPVYCPVDRPCAVRALLSLELIDFVADRDPFDDPVHYVLKYPCHFGAAGETNAGAKLARFVDPHLYRSAELAMNGVGVVAVQER